MERKRVEKRKEMTETGTKRIEGRQKESKRKETAGHAIMRIEMVKTWMRDV